MNKIITTFTVGIIVLICSPILFAGGVNMNPNQSAEWYKTLNRHATTDPDAVFYNPGGTALMAEGVHLYISDQFILQPITVKGASLSKKSYKGNKTVRYYPNLYLVYKKESYSLSLGAFALGGGGSANFGEGLQMIDLMLAPQPVGMGNTIQRIYTILGLPNVLGTSASPSLIKSSIKGSSFSYAAQILFSYEILKDRLGISVGGRYMYGKGSMNITIKNYGNGYGGYIPFGSPMQSEQKGMSGGVVAGICYKPIKDLTLGLSGEWNAPYRLSVKSTNYLVVMLVDKTYANGATKHQQLPANLHGGIAYRIKGLQISGSFSYFFNQYAQMKGKERNYTGGIDAGVGFDYTFAEVPLNIGIGYLFTTRGARPSGKSQLEDNLNSNIVGIGLSYMFNDIVQLTVGGAYTYYIPYNVNKGMKSALRLFRAMYYKQNVAASIGLTFKIKT